MAYGIVMLCLGDPHVFLFCNMSDTCFPIKLLPLRQTHHPKTLGIVSEKDIGPQAEH